MHSILMASWPHGLMDVVALAVISASHKGTPAAFASRAPLQPPRMPSKHSRTRLRSCFMFIPIKLTRSSDLK